MTSKNNLLDAFFKEIVQGIQKKYYFSSAVLPNMLIFHFKTKNAFFAKYMSFYFKNFNSIVFPSQFYMKITKNPKAI